LAYLENVIESDINDFYKGLALDLDDTGLKARVRMRPDSSLVFRFRVDSLRTATEPIEVAVVIKALPPI
jgi:hypothetical protein